jgi:hypothetical protein
MNLRGIPPFSADVAKNWVHACLGAKEWPDSVEVAVNVSPAQFKVSKCVRVRPKQRKADDLGSLRGRSEDRASRPSSAATFIKYLSFLMRFQAFPALEQPLLAKLARIGIGPRQSLDPATYSPDVIKAR